MLIHLWVQYRDRYEGIGFITGGYALQTVGYILIAIRSFLPVWLSLDVANALSVAGMFIGLIGFEKYTTRKISHIYSYILIFILAAAWIWLRFIRQDLAPRYLLISFASFGFFVQYAWFLLAVAPKKMRVLTRYPGYVFIFFSLVAAFKIGEFLLNSDKPADYFLSGPIEGLLMLIYCMLIIILTFSLVLMFNKNLLIHIKREEEKFSTSFHTAPNAIVLTTFPEGKVIEVNSAFLEVLGYTLEEVSGKFTSDFKVWKHQEDKEEAAREMMKSGNIYKREYYFVRKNGEVFKGLISARLVMFGNEKCMITSIFDVSEKQHFQDMISHERNLLRTLIDHLPDPVTIKDTEGRYLLNNQAHLQVIGAETQEEVLGHTTYDYFPPEDASIYDRDDKSVLESGKMIIDKIESAIHEETGFPYWHLTSKIPIKDKSGKSVQILTISHDITERKKAEDALKDSDEFNRSLLKTIPFGMDVVDESGTILFVGENFRKIFGEDVTGKKCWDVYRDDKKQCKECPLVNGITIGSTEVYESHGILGGKIFDVYHTGMMFHGKKAMLEIFHDITERKKTEGELIRSKEKAEESDRLKTAFLHNISHEIRTPMNAIVGFANLLREPILSPEEQQSFTEIISKSSNHLLSIV
ncbi:MAG TPA: PAS domain S-box protein, partial [Bacteroidales bacterium]|nr:PAS domain S-box protein [Bacteroidales bacterium]